MPTGIEAFRLFLLGAWIITMTLMMVCLQQAKKARGYEKGQFGALAVLCGFELFSVGIVLIATFKA